MELSSTLGPSASAVRGNDGFGRHIPIGIRSESTGFIMFARTEAGAMASRSAAAIRA